MGYLPGAVGHGRGIVCAALAALATAAPAHAGVRPGPDVLYAPPPRAPQLENAGPWKAPPILISGAQAYRDGEFIYQDWIYDDYGAGGGGDPEDPVGPGSHLFSPKTGSLTYPTDPVFARHGADLVELRVKPLGHATAFRVTFNTLQDPARTAFTIAIGDGPSVAWPHAAGVSSPARLFLTWHGREAELRDAAGKAIPAGAPTVSVDLERRQVELRVPHTAWDPGSGTVRLAAGAGLWDTAAGTYLQPASGTATETTPGGASPNGAALFNVAFRASEPMPEMQPGVGRTFGDAAAGAKAQGHWWRERAQADALRAGDVSAFFADVDFGKLRSGTTDEAGVPKSGHMNRILASRFSFGQGRDFTKECGGLEAPDKDRCEGQFVGQLQPYAVYVPKKPPPRNGYGLTLLLHALSANHNQYLGSRHAEQYGERGAGSIVITPGGRGPDGFYYDTAEADTFETWADIARVYEIDPEWVSISGVSMGGIGSYRLGGRWPDLFARAAPIVAASTTSNNTRYLPAFRNLPLMSWVATFDQLQNIAWTEETLAAQRDLGLRFVQFRFESWDHLTPSTNDYYQPMADFLGEHRVERDPARVTYVIDPKPDNPARGLVADHAYWLSGLKARSEGLATIDVRSHGFGQGEPKVSGVVESEGVLSGGNHEPAPYTRREQTWEATGAPKADRLTVTATNVATATVDSRRARVSCAPTLELKSDGPLDLRIACPRPRTTRTARCAAAVRLRLPRVRGGRVTRAIVRHGRKRVLVRRGRNLRALRVRRVSPKAHSVRIELRTTKGKVRITRRVGACR